MTQTPPPTSSSNPTEPGSVSVEPQAPAAVPEAPNYAAMFGKGCGWTLLSIVLVGGVVMFGGHGDATSWGSAIAGAIILIGVLGSSGLTGWWNK